jgi:hypothetical protein
VEIDAGQPLEEVVARAMSAIGSMITRNTDNEPAVVTCATNCDPEDRPRGICGHEA